MKPTALQVADVSMFYRSLPALQHISFTLNAPQRVGIIGPNGSGKSTLLRLLAGLDRPSSGTVTLNGTDVRRCRGAFAYLPQRATVDWEHPVRVRDVVTMGRYPHRRAFTRLTGEDHRVIDAALTQVGLDALGNVRVGALSGGQQQRMFLARALAQQANVFMLDEPYAALDQPSVAIMERELDAVAARGALVVVVSHDLSRLTDRFDTVVLLANRLVAVGPPAQVVSQDMLAQVYGWQPPAKETP
jgi:ABC-type Mn2+/Zn2+ transport system ATPase subunit